MCEDLDLDDIIKGLAATETVEADDKDLFPEQENEDENEKFNVWLKNPEMALKMCAEHRKNLEFRRMVLTKLPEKEEHMKKSAQFVGASNQYFSAFKAELEAKDLKLDAADDELLDFYHLAHGGYFAIVHKDCDVQIMLRNKAKKGLFENGWDKKYETWMKQFEV